VTTEDPYENDPFHVKVTKLGRRFAVRGWGGPYYTQPDAPRSDGQWEICMGKRDEPSSRSNSRQTVSVFARKRYTIEEAANVSVDTMAYDLAIAVAGRAAHEALEWCWLDGETFVDPHKEVVIAKAAELIRQRLISKREDT